MPEILSQPPQEAPRSKTEIGRLERNRLIAHLGRTFARRYDIRVLPSGQKGLWACGLDPKVIPEINKYIEGERSDLNDLPKESFEPKQILFDAETAQDMSMDEITTILHHEAGHAKYTDFRLMFEGQRQAKDEGHLPTSFWLAWEGIEDPRVNSLEGEESPAIDRQIRINQGADLQKRITEAPLSQRPLMLQFAYDSFHRWLNNGEGISELAGTEVEKLTELARPLLEQYSQNTDLEQRRLLQKQIWDIAKQLEKKDIQDEEKRQMAQKKNGQKGNQGQQEPKMEGSDSQPGQGEPQPGSGGQPSKPGSGSKFQSGIPGDKGSLGKQSADKAQGQEGKKSFLKRLKDTMFGQKKDASDAAAGEQEDKPAKEQDGKGEKDGKQKQERMDLSQLSPEELKEIEDAINQLSPEDRQKLEKEAREAIDQMQKEALEEELSKTMKMEKNKKTGEYEVKPKLADQKTEDKAEEEFKEATDQVEKEEQDEWAKEEAAKREQEEALKRLEKERREKLEMEKAGFDENEREKFLLYQSLEDAMSAYVRNFRQAIEKVIPRKKEGVYEGGFFSGPKFDRRDVVRKAPLGNEQFHMRQVERPIGEPRLFIGLLIDNSGSMGGKKMEEARKTVIFFSKVCKDMGIPFMTGAFGDNAEVIKQFRQDFDSPAEKIKPKIIDATEANAPSTNLHAGLEITIEKMNEERRKLRDSHGLIFVITDGGANAGLTGDELSNYIEENRGRLTFKAFGFPGTETFLNEYFGESNCVYPKGFEDLPDEAFRVLRVSLMQFQKFLS